jgi:hypothetical protein
VAIPGESRIRERKPPRWLPLQALPITPDRGGYPRPEGGYLGRAVSGRGNPRVGSLFRLFPIRWTVGGISTGGRHPPGGGGPHPGERTRASSFFWLSPYTGPWEVSPRGDVIPRGEGRIRESEPPRQLILLAFPIYWTVGGISTGGTSSPGGRTVSGRVNPRASSFFWLSPYTGPWEVSPRGDVIPPGGEGWLRESEPPRQLFLLAFPTHWTVGGISTGGRHPPGGEGRIRESEPPRQLILLAFPIYWTVGGISTGGRHPPGGGPHPGERTPAPAHSSGFPHTLDRGRYLHGGRGRRGGGMRPLPCLFVSRNTPLRIPNVRWQRALPTVPGHDGDEKFEYGCNNLISRSEDNMETLPVKK